MTTPHRADVLVIGGGLAGATAAMQLARAGRTVTLLERDREPRDKVCGEFLSAEAMQMLRLLHLPIDSLGAVPIHTVRLCPERGVVEAALPFPAASLTRKRLDAALLDAASAAGVQVLRGAGVQALTKSASQWHAETIGGEVFEAPAAILATGKHDLRGFPRPAGRQGDLVAMKMYWRLTARQQASLAGHVELLLHPGGYTGLEPVEDGVANLCGLIKRSTLAELGGGWEAFLSHITRTCPQGRERLTGAEPLLPKPLAVSAIPYGFLRAEALGDQLWSVGDQAAVIPSFTGDGMSIALLSGFRAAQSIVRAETASAFQRKLHRDLRFQVAMATAVSRALVFGPSKSVLVKAARGWPALLPWTAAVTRLPASALAGVQLAM